MDHKVLHKDFQLNGCSFSSSDEILKYSKNRYPEIALFLQEWFSVSSTINVKTSGSTGKPKKILLEKNKMIHSALATGEYFNLKEKTTAVLCLPIAYIAGKMMLIRAITLGWHLDIVASDSCPLKDVKKEHDFAAMVPLQVENSIEKIHLIKKLIVGGGVVSNQLQEKLQTVSTAVFATYGMTETITHIAIKKLNYISVNLNFYESLPNTTLFIDQRNCLVIKNDKISKEVVFTNDVVQLISDTQFNWLGRFDNVINSGGIKLHPEKIEEKIAKIITERFFVSGIPDEKLGEKLVLIIEGNLQEINLEAIALSKFEIPKEIYFVKEFIETETKKIQRKKTLDLIQF